MQADGLSTFFLQETCRRILILRLPLGKEQMKEALFLPLGFCFLPHEICSLGVLTQAWPGVRRFQQGLCLVGWELAFLRARLDQLGWSSCFRAEAPLAGGWPSLPPPTTSWGGYSRSCGLGPALVHSFFSSYEERIFLIPILQMRKERLRG